jgi:hypothetical protein
MADEREFRSIVRIKEGDDWRAAFVIDGRRYPDAASAAAAIDESARELDRLRIPAEVVSSPIRADEPAPGLPSWEEFREGLAGD